jgi:hypothetical protein
MAGKSSNFGNWAPGSPATRYKASGKNREFYTFENAPGIGAYATGGTVIDGEDGYIYHIFTGDGTFLVNRPPAAIDSVDYLIVAGGGGSASSPSGGGGGGGGFLFGNVTVSNAPGSYVITVGAGGPVTFPGTGSPSSAFSITAAGGGGSGPAPGGPGASGGSAGGGSGPGAFGGGSSSPVTIPRQGYPSGSSATFVPTNSNAGGGGGGAGGPGSNGTAGPPAIGGAGGPARIDPNFPSTIISKAIPAPVLPTWSPLVAPNGYAAGGTGRPAPAPLQRTSPANSGYGASGSGPDAGGSGIVCIRYKKTTPYSRATGGTVEPSTDPNHPGVWRHIFTTPGTFTVTDPTLQWIDYLAVGGGGGGGGAPAPLAGGGGGGGGFVTSIESSDSTPTVIPEAYPWNPGYSIRVGEQMPVAAGPYPVSIGPGGPGGGAAGGTGTTGTPTTIGAPGPTQIIAYGGGGGANAAPPAAIITGGSGASGGGGAKPATPGSGGGGSASPSGPISALGTQGNNGGPVPFPAALSGGAGGGASGSPGGPLVGGTGWYSVISPPAYGTSGPVSGRRYFAGGGGGFPGGAAPLGGGGGAGAPLTPRPATANTGGGGGSGGPSPGGLTAGTGGSGIVIIQYPE